MKAIEKLALYLLENGLVQGGDFIDMRFPNDRMRDWHDSRRSNIASTINERVNRSYGVCIEIKDAQKADTNN